MNLSRPHRLLASTGVVVALAALIAVLVVPSTAGAATRSLGSGRATFHLDPLETSILMDNLLEPYPIPPALVSLVGTSATLTLPVRGGSWDAVHARGTFLLKGGLSYVLPVQVVPVSTLTGEFETLSLSGWRAGVGTSAGFSIVAEGERTASFFDQTPMGSTSIVTLHGHRYVRVTKLQLSFSAAAVNAFTNTLNRAPTAGDTFGSVTLLARLK